MSKRDRKPANGVNVNGGKTGSGDGAASATGSDSIPGGGSGDGSGDGASGIIEPTRVSGGNGDGNGSGDGGTDSSPRRGRGRPPGSRTRPQKSEISVTTLAGVIAFAHVGLAAAFKAPAWELDDGEAKRLADAAKAVLAHHDTPEISGYAMDWVGLIIACGTVYGPRFATLRRARPAPQATQRPQAPPATPANQPPPARPDALPTGLDALPHAPPGMQDRPPAAPISEAPTTKTVLVDAPDGSGRKISMEVPG
jgi:hypothetical protein